VSIRTGTERWMPKSSKGSGIMTRQHQHSSCKNLRELYGRKDMRERFPHGF
jgi:hypothetical protein